MLKKSNSSLLLHIIFYDLSREIKHLILFLVFFYKCIKDNMCVDNLLQLLENFKKSDYKLN